MTRVICPVCRETVATLPEPSARWETLPGTARATLELEAKLDRTLTVLAAHAVLHGGLWTTTQGENR